MGFRARLKKSKQNLAKRHTQQTQNTGNMGRFPSIILADKLPANVKQWTKITEGEHIIDIIPWYVGPDMPLGRNGQPITEEGGLDYVLDIAVHQNIGTMKQPFVCPYINFGEPCPICEYMSSHDLDKETWKKLNAKRRNVFLVWNHDSREETKKGIQILEMSYFSMGEHLAGISKLPKGGGAINFTDPDEGKSIFFEREGTGATNTKYKSFKFLDREMEIPDKILDSTFAIDQVVHMRPSYEEIEKAFKGQLEMLDKASTTKQNSDAGNTYNGTGDDVPDWSDGWNDEEEEKKSRQDRMRKRQGKTRPGSSSSSSSKKPSSKSETSKPSSKPSSSKPSSKPKRRLRRR